MLFMTKYYFRKYSEKLILWVAWHLPRTIVYWSAIRLMTYEKNPYAPNTYLGNPAERKCIDALKEWEGRQYVEL